MTRLDLRAMLERLIAARGWDNKLTEPMLDLWVSETRGLEDTALRSALEHAVAEARGWGFVAPGKVKQESRRLMRQAKLRPARVPCDACQGEGVLSFYALIKEPEDRFALDTVPLKLPWEFDQHLRTAPDDRAYWRSFAVSCVCENAPAQMGKTDPMPLRQRVADIYRERHPDPMTTEEFKRDLLDRWPAVKGMTSKPMPVADIPKDKIPF